MSDIIQRDIDASTPHEVLMREWSMVADSLIGEALTLARHGAPEQLKFCVMALGKLGSMELNYESDVDLMFIYEGENESAVRVASRLIRILNDVTEDGLVFRVDTDLRPDGKQGPLVNTVDSLERYYERSGVEWERQALIRARTCAGEGALGAEFISRVTPFVYRRSVDILALKKIRANKLAMEKAASVTPGQNIKLGAGGIRELEYFVHTMQIIHGGKEKSLRTSNTLEAVKRLGEFNIIKKPQSEELRDLYIFLRRVENMVQAVSKRQTHILPEDEDVLIELSTKMGVSSPYELKRKLYDTMHRVEQYFSRLFETDYEKAEILDTMASNIETCTSIEEIIDSLPWFKNHVARKISEMDIEGKITLDEASERLTFLAEVILDEALKISFAKLLKNYGKPLTPSGKQAEMAIIGLGKFGTLEMDYGSDIDIVFVYSGDGNTDGQKVITNHEYFTRLSQTVISMITLPTRYGRAYDIDTALRPSGNQGALVTSYEAFDRYHRREGQLWERLALLKARIVAGDVSLKRRLVSLINDLVFHLPLAHDTAAQIDKMRKKVVAERKCPPNHIDIKYGIGSLADIESVVSLLQLKNGTREIEPQYKDDLAVLEKARHMYRRLISRARLFGAHTTETIDTSAPYFESLARSIGCESANECIKGIERHKSTVREIYSKLLGSGLTN